jgi:hypothetical protein
MNCNIKSTKDSISETQRMRTLKREKDKKIFIAWIFVAALGGGTIPSVAPWFFNTLNGLLTDTSSTEQKSSSQITADIALNPAKAAPAKSAAMFIGEHDFKKIVTKEAAKDFLSLLREYLEKNPDKVKDVLAILLSQKEMLSPEVKAGILSTVPKGSLGASEMKEYAKSINPLKTKKKVEVVAEKSNAAETKKASEPEPVKPAKQSKILKERDEETDQDQQPTHR